MIDVLLLAAFLYVLISWIRQSSSGSAARRISALGVVCAAVYLLSERFDLFLMTQLLRVLFLALLIAIVVVFQADIRRLLDRIATWEFSRGSTRLAAHSPVAIILDAVESLAERRVGALIAIRGHDPWGSQVSGGVELDGRISRPLLDSIFDPSSAGHDGAVLVEGDRVTRFAAHLPLATRIPAVSRFGGTRHAAALGLAEARDALVIVVSEERGTVSVAERGELKELDSPGELGPRLEAYWRSHYGEQAGGVGGRVRRHLETGIAALVLASLAWALFSYSGNTVSRSYDVPVEFRNLPVDWALDTDSVPSATVTVSGSERAIGQIDPGKLSIAIDMAHPREGVNRVPVTDQSVDLPGGVHLQDVVPASVRVVARQLVRARLPVHVQTSGFLPDTLLLHLDPDSIVVLLPAGESAPPALLTAPVDAAELLRGGAVTVDVVLPAGLRLLPKETPEVTVRAAGVQ